MSRFTLMPECAQSLCYAMLSGHRLLGNSFLRCTFQCLCRLRMVIHGCCFRLRCCVGTCHWGDMLLLNWWSRCGLTAAVLACVQVSCLLVCCLSMCLNISCRSTLA